MSGYRPDFAALAVSPTRIVIAVGEESIGLFTGRTPLATAELLGQQATVFPSHHGGFRGGESGYAGQPEAFARRLREVLGSTTLRRAALRRRWRITATMQGGHSCVTQFRNQEDTGGHERTRRVRRWSTGGHGRNRRDTEGPTVVSVRDREDEGSNPSPPIIFEFEIAEFGRHPQSPVHSRCTDPWEPRKRAGEVCRDGRPI